MDLIQIGLGNGQALTMVSGWSGRRAASVDGWS
jgi:hypothetical protein